MTPQQEKIVEWLEYYGDKGMTVYEAIMNGCGTELRSQANKIRKQGYPIGSKWESKNGKHFKRYFKGE